MAQLEYLSGSGQFQQSADGTRKFRYIVPTDEVAGFPSTKDGRTALLENWLGTRKSCGRGYAIDRRSMEGLKGYEIIEGHCR